jgi:ferredoxin
LALTELIEEDVHLFVMEVGSAAGADLLRDLPHRPATAKEIAAAERIVDRTRGQMGRTLETNGLKELLQANPNHPRWDEVSERCLTCGNCTNVCPTCFCTTIDNTTDLSGTTAERVRRWDSCFTLDFSYIHGGSVRSSARSRYRQWMTHKLAHWVDQFGSSGCVGCGRCITWCPVGIDITEEAAAIRPSRPVQIVHWVDRGDNPARGESHPRQPPRRPNRQLVLADWGCASGAIAPR